MPSELALFVFIARPPCAPQMNPLDPAKVQYCGTRFHSSGCPIRPFEAPRSSTQPPKRRPCTTWWLGRSLPNLATHVAIFARNGVSARNADHTLTDIPWAAAAAFCLRSSTVIRTTIPNTAVARSARNGAKKGCRVSFFMVLGRFLGETGSVCCRVCSIASSGYYEISLSVGLLRVVAHVPSMRQYF